jgi:hypothetical protein
LHLEVSAALLVLLCLAASGFADPIGLITIDSDKSARAAAQVVGTAFARVGNNYLVAAGAEEQAQFVALGIPFEPVLSGADASSVYCIYRLGHPEAPQEIELSRLGNIQELGEGLNVADISRAAAASLTETGDVKAVPLTELDIRIAYRPPSVSAVLSADDYPVDYLADLVERDSIYAFDQRLQDFQTRYTYTDSCLAARDWLKGKFLSWGYTNVDTQKFYYNGYYHYNVYATKIGTTYPDQYILVGGHYDSYTNGSQVPGPFEYAPGADDDGSGVALTLELARILASVPLKKSVIFMPFAAEEVGLKGSAEAAGRFADDNTKLEVMLNYDMVGFTDDALWDINLSSGDVTAYRTLAAMTAGRLTALAPVITYMGSSSDHYSFDQEGFNIVDAIETDFNYDGWHTNIDLTSRMNFPYLAEVVKMALVTAAIVAESPYPATVEQVVDVGDGQSLQVSWSDCCTECTYTVYWGTASGVYADSGTSAPGQCNYTITGLNTGTGYHVLAVGNTSDGYRALYGTEGSGTPYLYPLPPDGISGTADPDQLRTSVSWDDNREIDFSHYNVYRRVSEVGVFQLIQGGLTSTYFLDSDVQPQIEYTYRVTAVDLDGHESSPSGEISIYPATFDGGPVLVDAFSKVNDSEPEQAEQEAWFDSLFDGYGYSLTQSDEFKGPVGLGDIGRFGTLFWIDDDIVTKEMVSSGSALDEFADHQTNMFLGGWKYWYNWVGSPIPSSHVLNREFKLTAYEHRGVWDWVGAQGQNGWPSVAIDPTRGPDQFNDVAKLTLGPGAQVIYTYDSKNDYVDWEGQPVGLAYNGPNGKRILLAFPLYYLDQASARALIVKAVEFFGGGGLPQMGDINMSGTIDIADLALLLDHLFMSQTPLVEPSLADVDSRPGLSIGDAYYLINYLFADGSAPKR